MGEPDREVEIWEKIEGGFELATSADENDDAASQLVPDDQLQTDREKELRKQLRQFLFQKNRIKDPRVDYKGDKINWQNLDKPDATLQTDEEK